MLQVTTWNGEHCILPWNHKFHPTLITTMLVHVQQGNKTKQSMYFLPSSPQPGSKKNKTVSVASWVSIFLSANGENKINEHIQFSTDIKQRHHTRKKDTGKFLVVLTRAWYKWGDISGIVYISHLKIERMRKNVKKKTVQFGFFPCKMRCEQPKLK